MKPFVVLLAVFIISLLVIRLSGTGWNWPLAGNIAMSAMLLFTSLGHFKFAAGMALMLPPFIPFKTAMVYATGVIEIAAAIGLLISSMQQITAWLLIIFFILILPCNIYAAIQHVDYQKSDHNGPVTFYLWFRVPLQLVFIAWVYACNLLHI